MITAFVNCVNQAVISGVSQGTDAGHMATVNTREMTDPFSPSSVSFSGVISSAFISTFPQGLSSFLTYH